MAYDIGATEVFFALAGGLLPALLWLWFWLKEDSAHPEPRRVLLLTFIGGMMMAIVALFLEKIAQMLVSGFLGQASTGLNLAILLFIWAGIEEVVKYTAASRIALRLPFFDEPVDALIYLITAALGFAALENVLFLVKTFGSQGMLVGFITGNLRFLGATVLHSVTSATVGASIALSFFHKEKLRRNIFGGLLLATILHMFFNFFIINNGGSSFFTILIPLWFLTVIVFLVFEKVKGLKKE